MLKITMIILYLDAFWVYFILVVAKIKIPDWSLQNGNPQSSEQCQDVQQRRWGMLLILKIFTHKPN